MDIKVKDFVKIILYMAVILIWFIQILTIAKYKQIEEQQSELIRDLKEENKISENKLLVRENHISSMVGSNGLYLDQNLILISESFDTVKLKDFVNSNPILIFRYPKINCDNCVNILIKNIVELLNIYEIDQITFFAYYDKVSSLSNLKRLNQLQNKIYMIKNLDIEIENLNSPYFFLLNQDFKIEYVYIPDKKYSGRTKSYLKFIRSQLVNIK